MAVTLASLHPVARRDIQGRRVLWQRMTGSGGEVVALSCGCEVQRDRRTIDLCQFHSGYDLGLETGEALAEKHRADAG